MTSHHLLGNTRDPSEGTTAGRGRRPLDAAVQGPHARRFREREKRRDRLGIATVTSVAVAVGLFLADGGARQFGSPAEALTSAGIIVGLAATDLIVLMLLLAARLPLVDRTIGHDRALRLHGTLGKVVLYLLLAHGTLLIAGYALGDGVGWVSEGVQLWQRFFDLRLAVIGFALFVLVAVTSVVAARRRLRHEVWFAIHLLTYAAVAVSIPHQFSVGGLFLPGTVQRWYWLALYTFTGSALLVYRVLVPLIQTFRHDLRVARVVPEAPGVLSIEMTGRNLRQLQARGGQFFTWHFLGARTWWHGHPFSLSEAPAGNRLRITVRDLGSGTRKLMRLRPGTPVAIEGPYGLFSEEARTGERVVLIGAGIGIAPLCALLGDLSFAPGNAVVLLRAPSRQEIFLADDIAQRCAERGARLHFLTGPRSTTAASWLPEPAAGAGERLTTYVPDVTDTDLYVCGPDSWTDLVVVDARTAGIPAGAIHYERFTL